MDIRLPRRIQAGNFFCALALFGTGVFVVVYGSRYPLFENAAVGPGLMPLFAGTALAVSAAALVWQSVRSSEPASDCQSISDPSVVAEARGVDKAVERKGAATAAKVDKEAGPDLLAGGIEKAGSPATVIGILVLLALVALLAPTFGLIPMIGLLVFMCMKLFERQGLIAAVLMAAGISTASWLVFNHFFQVPMPTGTFWPTIGL